MPGLVQQPYNMFASQKMAGYPRAQEKPKNVPGQSVGATVQDFAAGKQAANSQTGAVSQPAAPQPPVQTQPKPVATPVQAPVQTAFSPQSMPITNTDELAAATGYTTPEQEEKLRRASVTNQRIMAVADAFRHIGNLVYTSQGAKPQTFSSPVMEEQARYERGKAIRDRANTVYLNYAQQKAAQEQKARQWEAEQRQKADQWQATFRYNAAKDAASLAERARQFDQNYKLGEQKAKDAKEANERRAKENERHHRAQTALGYANLKQRKEEFNFKKSGGGEKNRLNLRGKNGFYSKNMNPNEMNSFYNQTYNEFKKRGIINEGQVIAGLPADIFGNKTISQSAIKKAVDNALIEHPEVGDWLRDEYEFDFDPRGAQDGGAPMRPEQRQTTLFPTDWGGGASGHKANPFGEPGGGKKGNHKSNPFS